HRDVDTCLYDALLDVAERPDQELRLHAAARPEALAVDAGIAARPRVAELLAGRDGVAPAHAWRDPGCGLAPHLHLHAGGAVGVRARVAQPRVAVLRGVGTQAVALRHQPREP